VKKNDRRPAGEWKKQDVFAESAEWSPGKRRRARKKRGRKKEKKRKGKNFPESSRPQFRNNSRYDVTLALKWEPSARTSPLLLQRESKNNAGCLRRCSLPRGRSASKFLVSRAQKYICPRYFAKRSRERERERKRACERERSKRSRTSTILRGSFELLHKYYRRT